MHLSFKPSKYAGNVLHTQAKHATNQMSKQHPEIILTWTQKPCQSGLQQLSIKYPASISIFPHLEKSGNEFLNPKPSTCPTHYNSSVKRQYIIISICQTLLIMVILLVHRRITVTILIIHFRVLLFVLRFADEWSQCNLLRFW